MTFLNIKLVSTPPLLTPMRTPENDVEWVFAIEFQVDTLRTDPGLTLPGQRRWKNVPEKSFGSS
jgi:hypothetical protein